MPNKNSQPKIFVIDTNVFIHRPDALLSFHDNEIVVPLWVLEELDKLKTFSDERGRNARHAIRFLDEARKKGSLAEGVKLDNGSILRVMLNHSTKHELDFSPEKNDNKIILCAYKLHLEGRKVFFVSKDINARVKATALGIKAVDYEKQKVNIDTLYPGYIEADATRDTLKKLDITEEMDWNNSMHPNQYVLFHTHHTNEYAVARWDAGEKKLKYVPERPASTCGIRALNPQQEIALDLLLNPDIPLVTLVGKAGTGKTLLAIAAGLKATVETKTYTKVLVTRPVIPMGKDIGYLPGAKDEKLSHWMQPLFDNLEYILGVYKKPNFKTVDQLVNNKYLELEALAFIRGRSLPSQFIIIDEAQNLSPHEVKTIVSRAGEGTKMVLTGDPYQIDSPYLDSNSNGLTYLVEAMKGQKMFGHVTMQKSERSRLAELAAELL